MQARGGGVALTVVVVALAGCLAQPAALEEGPPGAARLLEQGVALEVPVDVVLVGFDAGTGAALRAALPPLTVRQLVKEDWRSLPPADASRGPHVPSFTDALLPLPLEATARFRVHETDPALARAFGEVAAANEVGPGVYDANIAEDWLASALPAAGIALPEGRPALVLLHAGGVLPEGHAWRSTYLNGYLEPTRVFGERHPLLVLDASAGPDPAVTAQHDLVATTVLPLLLESRAAGPRPYDQPLASGGAASVEALALAVTEATLHRLLQGAIYAPPRPACHAVTLLLAVRSGALTESLPGYLRAEDLVDVDLLDRAWENLTGPGTVHVDLKVLRLPQEDPPLEAFTRAAVGVYGASRGLTDAFRYWVSENWDRYWVPHEGCEGYVSALVLGDAADALGGGISLYDPHEGRRMSFSVDPDLNRAFSAAMGAPPTPLTTEDPSQPAYWALNLLFAHETAHLMGQNHPHNRFTAEEGRVELWSWSSVWTAMSYQTGVRTADFGAVERANHQRNLAAFLLQDAREAGSEPADLAPALEALAAQEWRRAAELLRPLAV